MKKNIGVCEVCHEKKQLIMLLDICEECLKRYIEETDK